MIRAFNNILSFAAAGVCLFWIGAVIAFDVPLPLWAAPFGAVTFGFGLRGALDGLAEMEEAQQ